jgi:hypothetical protein
MSFPARQHPKWNAPLAVTSLDTSDVHVGQVDQYLAQAGGVCLHGGSSNLRVLNHQQNCRAPAHL